MFSNPESTLPTETLETVLVVDDNPAVLKTVSSILSRANFKVLSAGCGQDALALAEATEDPIHLLLSDIDMPNMSGPALGEEMKLVRPDIRVMFMSGGASDGSLLVLNYGWAYIAKPFVMGKLIQMVTDVLHEPDRSQAGGQEFDSRKDRDRT